MPTLKSAPPRSVGQVLRNLLWPLAFLYDRLARLRHWLFDKGFLKAEKLPRPVLSVGNLAMGGTGKSPLTMALIEACLARGMRVAVLSRGYGRKHPQQSLQVTASTSFRDGGDEPVMMARRYPQALIAVGPTRAAAARVLPEQPDIYLLDDGFQHRPLERDFDLVLIDVTQGPPKPFPVGLFREGWWGLRRADAAILTRWQPGVDMQPWQQRIQREKRSLPVFACGFKPQNLHEPAGKIVGDVSKLAGMRIAAFCGIAKPQLFFKSLEELGAVLVKTKVLPDHGVFAPDKAAHWFQTVAGLGVDAVITTEKDAVKLDNYAGFGIVVLFLSTGVIWHGPSPLDRILNKLPS